MKKILLLFLLFFGIYSISNADVVPTLSLTHGTGTSLSSNPLSAVSTPIYITDKNTYIKISGSRAGGIYASGFTNFGVDLVFSGNLNFINGYNDYLKTYVSWVDSRLIGTITKYEFNPFLYQNNFTLFSSGETLKTISGIGFSYYNFKFNDISCGSGIIEYSGRFTSSNWGNSAFSTPNKIYYDFGDCIGNISNISNDGLYLDNPNFTSTGYLNFAYQDNYGNYFINIDSFKIILFLVFITIIFLVIITSISIKAFNSGRGK